MTSISQKYLSILYSFNLTSYLMEIKSLETVDFDSLFKSFERAFEDYAIHFEKEEVRSMLIRRGYDPKLSFGAFVDDEMVAFTLNGIGRFNGTATAYDTGTGTVKEYRGDGIAGRIFTYSIPFLKEAGVGQYLLEVLQDNQKAIAVYSRMNFEVTREFLCFRQMIEHIDNPIINTGCRTMTVDINHIRRAQQCLDFDPSWQNSIESIERGISDLTYLGAFIDNRMVGYCVLDVHTGDLSQIAVQCDHRRKGIASRLLHEAIALMKTDFIKVLNISADDSTMPAFLQSKNIVQASKQYEMVLRL